MNKRFIFLLTVVALFSVLFTPFSAEGQTRDEAIWNPSEQGYNHLQEITGFTIGQMAQGILAKASGSAVPVYYQNQNPMAGVRLYAKNTLTISALSDALITKVEYTFYKQGSKAYALVSCSDPNHFTSGGTATNSTPAIDIWSNEEGLKTPLVLTLGSSGQRLLTQIKVTATMQGTGATYTVTYDANGGTGTLVDPNSPYPAGAIVTVLPNGFQRDGFIFDKWNTSSDGLGTDRYPNSSFTLTGPVTLFAQWISVSGGVYDVLNPTNVNEAIGGNSGYSPWEVTLRTGGRESKYKGLTCKNSDAIQMTHSTSGTSKYSGIVTTQSIGKVKKVQVVWDEATVAGRTLEVYGRTTAYESTDDLYTSNQGTLLGTIVKGSSTEYVLTDDQLAQNYTHVGLRSSTGAMYLDEIRILWNEVTEVPGIQFSPATLNLGNVLAGSQLVTEFVVTQTNLSNNITLSSEEGMSFEPSTIERGAAATTVTLNYTVPTNVGQHTVNVVATSGDVSSTLPVTMTVVSATGVSLHDAKIAFIDNNNAAALINLQDVEVVGRDGNYLYLQDAERGLLVYGALPEELSGLTTGCKFIGGTLMGTFTYYHDICEFTNFSFQDPDWTTVDAITEVLVENVDDLNATEHVFEHRYVKIENMQVTVASNNIDWTVGNSTGSIALTDNFGVGYAGKTVPEVSNLTVKGLYNPCYYSGAKHFELVPTNLSDIHTSTQAAAVAVNPAGGSSASEAVAATLVTLTPAQNTKVVYEVNRDDRLESTEAVTINITGNVSIIVHSERDFYEPSQSVSYFYKLPDNARMVTFSVNGNESSVRVSQNSSGLYVLYANQCPAVANLGDFTFRGWSTAEDATNTITLGSGYIVSYPEGVQNVKLYAVYGKATEHVFARISNPTEITEGEYVIVGNNNYVLKNEAANAPEAFTFESLGITVSGVLSGDLTGVTWTFEGNPSAMTITSTANASHTLYGYEGSTTVVVGNAGNTIHQWYVGEDNTLNGMFNIKHTQYNRYLALYNNQDWRAYTQGNANASNNYLRLSLYKKIPNPQSDDARYTRVFVDEIANSEIYINGPSIIPSGSYLNMNGNLFHCESTDNFVIEDGATFIPASGNVGIKATVHKGFLGYGTDASVQNGWYLFTSPIGLVNANGIQQQGGGSVSGLIPDNSSYDLYTFNPNESDEWRNHKAEGYSTVFGGNTGVLYATQADRTAVFKGTLVTACVDQGFAYTGWNLIGNPFTCKAYFNMSDFYRLVEVDRDGNLVSELQLADNTTPVDPMEGIFVQTTTSSQTYSFTTTQNAGQNGQGAVNIEVMDGNGLVVDKARMRFGEGGMLGKYMLHEGGTRLCVQQGGTDYAVVRALNDGEQPVSFKAAESGTYTLSVETKNVEMNYLHLIDNMTGADVDLLALRQAQGSATYTFEAKTTDYASRFRLVFSANSISEDADGDNVFAYFNGSSWTINNIGEATLQVVDVMGRILSSETISGNTEININQPAGVYMLRLVSGDSVKVQKVVVR